ncbi:MAG: acyltransferase [Syntrophomonadaceae bacterium]|jgi:surface polysaccharide O-acyltransferase-like enzyme
MTTKRDYMYDVLKGLGIITVIFSHVYRGSTDPLGVFVRELAMWCVPMFFMVQGHFMSSASRWLQSSWKKIRNTYIPYLYWAIAYGVFYWVTIGKEFTITDLVLGKTALHLYYMFYYMLFALLCPLLYLLPKTLRRYFLYFMIISNFAMTLILEISKTYGLHIISYSGPNPIKWWGFIAIGMLIKEYPQIREYISKHARAFFWGAIAVAMVGLLEPYFNNTIGYLFNKAAVFPLSIGVTLALAIYYSGENRPGKKILSFVGNRTLGIYLGHFFLVDPLRALIPGDRTLVALIVLFACIAVKDLKDCLLGYLSSSQKAK